VGEAGESVWHSWGVGQLGSFMAAGESQGDWGVSRRLGTQGGWGVRAAGESERLRSLRAAGESGRHSVAMLMCKGWSRPRCMVPCTCQQLQGAGTSVSAAAAAGAMPTAATTLYDAHSAALHLAFAEAHLMVLVLDVLHAVTEGAAAALRRAEGHAMALHAAYAGSCRSVKRPNGAGGCSSVCSADRNC